MRFTHYCQGIFGSWPCQQTELENICRCMYINTSNYTYIHTNAFTNVQCTETGIHTNTYFRNHEFTQIPQIPIQHPKKVLLVCFFFASYHSMSVLYAYYSKNPCSHYRHINSLTWSYNTPKMLSDFLWQYRYQKTKQDPELPQKTLVFVDVSSSYSHCP